MSSLVVSGTSASQTPTGDSLEQATPRERILEVAYALFSRAAVRAVGVDEVVDRAGVAKATLYRHFPTKDDLVVAFLALREERFTRNFLEAEVEQRAEAPEGRLLAIFEVFDDWFNRDDFEACSFINVLLELGREHPAGAASIRHLEHVRAFPERLAREAGLRDPSSFACAWHILMKGAIIAAAEGERHAAICAGDVGRKLLAAAR
jgi:AcrR family transcriptional regulator